MTLKYVGIANLSKKICKIILQSYKLECSKVDMLISNCLFF